VPPHSQQRRAPFQAREFFGSRCSALHRCAIDARAISRGDDAAESDTNSARRSRHHGMTWPLRNPVGFFRTVARTSGLCIPLFNEVFRGNVTRGLAFARWRRTLMGPALRGSPARARSHLLWSCLCVATLLTIPLQATGVSDTAAAEHADCQREDDAVVTHTTVTPPPVTNHVTLFADCSPIQCRDAVVKRLNNRGGQPDVRMTGKVLPVCSEVCAVEALTCTTSISNSRWT
jgi:hypothetical protein